MGRSKENGPMLLQRRVQTVYRKCTTQRRVVMDEIFEIRANHRKHFMKTLIRRVGPKWYQIFSTKQRAAVGFTKDVIYRTVISGNIEYIQRLLTNIGAYRFPERKHLMSCVYMAREDPKELFAQLFHYTYGQSFESRIPEYDLNAKILLTSIYHLGFTDLTSRLKEMFSPDTKEPPPPPKPRAKRPPKPKSPYLDTSVAAVWTKAKRKPFVPPPLPNLESLDEPFATTPVPIVVIPPPPPRIAKNFTACDQLLGLRFPSPERSLSPPKSKQRKRNLTAITILPRSSVPRAPKIYCRQKGLVAPRCDTENNNFQINGVMCVKGKYVYVLGGIITLPLQGEFINGGHQEREGANINIILGVRGTCPIPAEDPCDCRKKYKKIVFDYLKSSQCRCGHNYDFGHEGTFPAKEIPYFTKPTRDLPMEFNYDAIYELNPKTIHVNKKFRKLWQKDSMLTTVVKKESEPRNVGKKDTKRTTDTKKESQLQKVAKKDNRRINVAKKEPELQNVAKKDNRRKIEAKKELQFQSVGKKYDKRSSDAEEEAELQILAMNKANCLGDKPRANDYLRCALGHMRRDNMAARLPDLHKAPELKEWMRFRLHGPLNPKQRARIVEKSQHQSYVFQTLLTSHKWRHITPKKNPAFCDISDWGQLNRLRRQFAAFAEKYRNQFYVNNAYITNLLWTVMYQGELPSIKFRDIYFAYMLDGLRDLHLCKPYSAKDSLIRAKFIDTNRMLCVPREVLMFKETL